MYVWDVWDGGLVEVINEGNIWEQIEIDQYLTCRAVDL